MSDAPRLSPKDIESVVDAEYYVRLSDVFQQAPIHPSLSCMTLCVLVLKNGFVVTGESACVSPENFDAELGRKVARTKAIDKIWPLEGYLLKQKMS